MRTNFEAAKSYVNAKRRDNHESLSGPGSHLSNTKETIKLINSAIKNHNIQTVLDLGCGDFNWLRKVDLRDAEYIGWDACPQMIEDNNKKYGNKNIRFFVEDIVLKDYPEVDLIICRDVLFHIKKSISKKIIDNIKKKCKYLVSTSFKGINKNSDINHDWGFYAINLDIEPFNLKTYEIKHKQEVWGTGGPITHRGEKRFICLYKIAH